MPFFRVSEAKWGKDVLGLLGLLCNTDPSLREHCEAYQDFFFKVRLKVSVDIV